MDNNVQSQGQSQNPSGKPGDSSVSKEGQKKDQDKSLGNKNKDGTQTSGAGSSGSAEQSGNARGS